MRGAELRVKQRGVVGGRKIEIIKALVRRQARRRRQRDAQARRAGQGRHHGRPAVRREGIAVKDYSKTQPQITFINGVSGAQATTLVDPAPNFFRFNTEGAQWMVGLGKAALDKGYKRVMVIAEDYCVPVLAGAGLHAEYCQARRQGAEKAWVPLGGKDYSSVIAQDPEGRRRAAGRARRRRRGELPEPVRAAGGDKPIVGGSITVSQDVLNYSGKRRDSLVGTLSAGPMADAYDGAEWKASSPTTRRTIRFGRRLPEPVAVRLRVLQST
jgi:branched-chain amino acid transport system substrate-binding protein